MAENSGIDPTVDSSVDENVTQDGTMIAITVKTPKDKEQIVVSEDASVSLVLHSTVFAAGCHGLALGARLIELMANCS